MTRSAKYLSWLRHLPCANCGKPGSSEAAHGPNAALYEIERLRSALTIARQGLRDCRCAATPAQADEWATDALLRSSIEEHLAETDTGGES